MRFIKFINDQLTAQQDLLKLLTSKEEELRYNKISALFPKTGPYRRELYPKHLAFMHAGKTHMERAFVAANRTGKTLTGGCEFSYHMTGLYPDDWEGRQFKNAVDCWAVGISNQSTKEIQQTELLGDVNDFGSGLIPKDKIARKEDGSFYITKKPGVADAVETFYVKHVSGALSKCTFKSYEQGRDKFQGVHKDVIWLDEEPDDPKIYSECLTRLMDEHNPGLIYCTFTPLLGMSDVVKQFLPDRIFPKDGIDPNNPYKYVVNVSWEEVPHLSGDQKRQILASYSLHERDARSKGIPSLGSGAIFPYSEEDILVNPFQIPIWWPRAFGLDVGWNRTAAIWGALDPDSGIFYLYSEHYEGKAVPAIHASAIKGRGEWIWGAADPDGVNLSDGSRMFQIYESEGLNLVKADKKSVEAGLFKTCQMFEAGQIKVFNTLKEWTKEYRGYCRDENGKITKKNDHLMDATRYLIVTGMNYLECPPDNSTIRTSSSCAVRDKYTGY